MFLLMCVNSCLLMCLLVCLQMRMVHLVLRSMGDGGAEAAQQASGAATQLLRQLLDPAQLLLEGQLADFGVLLQLVLHDCTLAGAPEDTAALLACFDVPTWVQALAEQGELECRLRCVGVCV